MNDDEIDTSDSPEVSLKGGVRGLFYRKKPVVIQAIQWTGENTDELETFMQRALVCDHENAIVIETIDGTMHAQRGDWVIKGIKGEFYPCKPDIFEATYEPAE